MAITVEGVRVNTTIEALETGEGFLMRVNADWQFNRNDTEKRAAVRYAQQNDILGSRLNGHEDTYANAETAITTAVNNFESDLTTFISDWNAGNVGGESNPNT